MGGGGDDKKSSARTEKRVKLGILGCMFAGGYLMVNYEALTAAAEVEYAPAVERHESTWVVSIGASRYFSNYRHGSNALAVRRAASGVPSERVILMLAANAGCDARNSRRGEVYLSADATRRQEPNNLYEGDCFADVDYSGLDVTPQSVVDLLAGRHAPSEPRSRRLMSTARSNVLIYLTGHGGDEFLKFHDSEELSATSLAWALQEMSAKKRYRKVLLIVDTCQAASLFNKLSSRTTPHVIAIASAITGQNAYASAPDPELGVALADRFTERALTWLAKHGHETLGDFVDAMRRAPTRSTLFIKDTAHQSDEPEAWRRTPLSDFFQEPDTIKLSPWPSS